MRSAVAVTLLAAWLATAGEPGTSARIAALRKEVESGNTAAIAQFWEEMRKNRTPLVEAVPGEARYSFVTFVWQGKPDTHNVVILGGVAGYDFAKNQMLHLENTDVWYRSYKVRNDVRFSYTFSPNDSLVPIDKLDPKDSAAMMKRMSTFRADPLNPARALGGPPAASFELPEAPPQVWLKPMADAPKGRLQTKKLASTILKNERNVWVYTPAGFDPNGERYPLLVLSDGAAYTFLTPTATILDNLIAKKLIPPMIAVILDNVTSTSRQTELACSSTFTDFLAKEVVPWARENYRATMDPARTIVGGASLGGLAAAYAGFRYPNVFGSVLSQSGSYWWKPEGETEHEWLTREFVRSPRLPLRLYLEVGLMEDGPTPDGGPSMIVVNRHLRDVLNAKGYTIQYHEFNGGHEFLNWRGSFADGLLYLMGNH